MIELYTFGTPNGRKISIALEELGLAYNVHTVHIGKNEQFAPAYVAINPNSKIPSIVDTDTGITVFESGAILLYLAEKTGQLLPKETAKRFEVIEWLMFQMAGVGPMFGQVNHFKKFAPEPVPYAIERYSKEAKRLQKVLDTRLQGREYICGAYSIADIATYPWVAVHDFMGIPIDDCPDLVRWTKAMAERPAVQRGMKVP
jgi:GST-like protein